MAHRQSAQFKRQQRFLKEIWFCFTVILIVCILFSMAAINHAFTLSHWTTDGTVHYVGSYSLSTYHYLRNTHYRFTLDNGDIVSVPSEHIRQIDDFSKYTVLSFRYCRNKSVFRLGTHDSIEINIPGENLYIQYSEATRKNMQEELILYSILGVVCLVILATFIVFLIHTPKKTNKRPNRTGDGSLS